MACGAGRTGGGVGECANSNPGRIKSGTAALRFWDGPGTLSLVYNYGNRARRWSSSHAAPAFADPSYVSACSGPRYVVFFQERSAQLDGQAQNVVSRAAARANNNPTSSVKVVGYTDSAGSPPADVALSQKRAQTVADALVANGVGKDRLMREGHGQTGEIRASQADAWKSLPTILSCAPRGPRRV